MIKILKTDLSLISQNLLFGSVGIMPSDTVYGIFARALNSASVERIYSIKKRDLNKPFIILISDISDLDTLGIKLSDRQFSFVNKYWPGPLSLIFDCKDSKLEYLHRRTNSLAIRLPKDDWLRSLIKITGPLVAPSANLQNFPTVKIIDEAVNIFGDKVDFYVNGGICEGKPSTLVRFNNNKFEVLRSGCLEINNEDTFGTLIK